MSVITVPTRTAFQTVTLDIYRDIHKGIRSELFRVAGAAGRIDPADRSARAEVARDVHGVVDLLVVHAEHEDTEVGPVLERELPDLAEKIVCDHAVLEARMDGLRALADEALDSAPGASRDRVHHLYLDFASFTSAYLEHQDVEERVVMPALETAVGVDAVFAINQAIVSSIPPDLMASSLAFMLPAMNIDDRTEMLGGMQRGAPPEVFAGVWGLATSVLAPADHAALAARLGIA